jgi:hypothetical protein
MTDSSRRSRHWVVFLAGVLSLALLLAHSIRSNPQWQTFRWTAFLEVFVEMDPRWAAAALAAVYATYLVRALRWRILMRNLKPHSSLWNLFSATVIGFAAIGVLGRAGEMVRPYLVSRKEGVPMTSQLAVWLVERCFDTLTVLATVAFALGRFETEALRDSPTLAHGLQMGGRVVAATTGVILVLMIALRNWSAPLTDWLVRHLPRRLRAAEHHLRAFEEGTRGLHDLRALAACVWYSVLEWVLIAACYAAVFNSFSGGLRLSATQTLIFMGCVMLGSIVNIPGIGGGIQVASLLVLTELFGLRPEPAAGISLLIWGFTFLAVVPPALLLMVHEGLSWSRLRHLEAPNAGESV